MFFHCNSLDKKEEIKNLYINQASKEEIKKDSHICKKEIQDNGGELLDYKDWKKNVIKPIFHKLSQNWIGHFQINNNFIHIVDSNQANAVTCGLSGEFIFYKGLLELINSKCKNKLSCQKDYIAPLISHELAHYYYMHPIILQRLKEKQLSESQYKNKRIMIEYLADEYSFVILKDSKFFNDASDDTILDKIITSLKLMNQDDSFVKELIHSIKKTIRILLSYTKTHPSIKQRIQNLQSNREKVFNKTKELLKNFQIVKNSVRTAQNQKKLEECIRFFENRIESLDILWIKAVAYHKLWSFSASLSYLKFKPIIDVPFLGEGSLLTDKPTINKGKKLYYQKAKQYYQRLDKLKITKVDLKLKSNYALLLTYSDIYFGYKDVKRDKRKAIVYSKQAIVKSDKNLELYNNYAIVLYVNGRKEKALKIFENLYKKKNKFSSTSYRDQTYIADQSRVPILNYCLALYYTNMKNLTPVRQKILKIVSQEDFICDKRSNVSNEWEKFLCSKIRENL